MEIGWVDDFDVGERRISEAKVKTAEAAGWAKHCRRFRDVQVGQTLCL